MESMGPWDSTVAQWTTMGLHYSPHGQVWVDGTPLYPTWTTMGLHRSLGGQLALGRTAGFEPCTSVLELGSPMFYPLRHQNFQTFINFQEGARRILHARSSQLSQ